MSHSQRVPSEVNRSGRNLRSHARPLEGRLFLRDEELDAGVALILMAQKQLLNASGEAMRAGGVNKGEFDLLMGIRAAPGMSVSQMRVRLGMTVPSFARILGQLDKRNLIEKARSGRDGRARLLELSEEGERLAEPIAKEMRNILLLAYRDAGAEQVAGARRVLSAITEYGDSDG